jgi:hypothetical protein
MNNDDQLPKASGGSHSIKNRVCAYLRSLSNPFAFQLSRCPCAEAAIEDQYYRNKKSGIQVGMSALSQMVNTRAPASPKAAKAPRGLMSAKPNAKDEALDHFKNVLFSTKLNILLIFIPFAMVGLCTLQSS